MAKRRNVKRKRNSRKRRKVRKVRRKNVKRKKRKPKMKRKRRKRKGGSNVNNKQRIEEINLRKQILRDKIQTKKLKSTYDNIVLIDQDIAYTFDQIQDKYPGLLDEVKKSIFAVEIEDKNLWDYYFLEDEKVYKENKYIFSIKKNFKNDVFTIKYYDGEEIFIEIISDITKKNLKLYNKNNLIQYLLRTCSK